jgi:hypothetical protein
MNTPETDLPSTGGFSNWNTAVVVNDIALEAGVQSMRMYVGGVSNSCQVDSMTVVPLPPLVTTWPTASQLVYGQALSDSTLEGGSGSVPGTFAFDAPATVLNAGNHNVLVTYTPSDAETYDPVSWYVTVAVAKAIPGGLTPFF